MQIWPAPAKLNLFLHVIGQREDGYHMLQSAIQFIDLCDELNFTLRKDSKINCKNSNNKISEQEDLCVKSAQLLQTSTGSEQGVDIQLKKNIPVGAGLGGGSSDAATTLLALNQIWSCGLQQPELESLGMELGADVPVFLRGHACWVEGVGEQLEKITLEESWYVVVYPHVHLDTQKMFADPDLTRNCAPIKIRDFLAISSGSSNHQKLAGFKKFRNVFEPLARRQPAIEHAFQYLNQYGIARLTGSGSCIFLACESKEKAEVIAASGDKNITAYVTKSLNESPVKMFSEYN